MYVEYNVKEETKIDHSFLDYNDNELLYLMREGDFIAEEIFYEKYSFLISKLLKSYGLTGDFEDNFQECLIVLSKAIDSYVDSPLGFFPFFYRALMNKIISMIRKKSAIKTKKIVINDMVLGLSDPINEEEILYKNDKIFHGLSNFQIDLIDYKYNKKYSVKEISKLFGIKTERIYYLLKLAREKILKNCENYYK